MQGCNFFCGKSSQHFAGRTYDQRIVRDNHALWNECVGPNQTIVANDGMVEDDAMDADQAVIAYGAAVQHGQVADGDVVAYGQWCAGVSVQYRAILNVGVAADAYRFIISAYDCTEPDADIVVHDDRTDDAGAGGDKVMLAVQYRGMAL